MYKIRKELKRFLKEEKAQGATEYILILVAIVALVMLFKTKIMEIAGELLANLQGKTGEVFK